MSPGEGGRPHTGRRHRGVSQLHVYAGDAARCTATSLEIRSVCAYRPCVCSPWLVPRLGQGLLDGAPEGRGTGGNAASRGNDACKSGRVRWPYFRTRKAKLSIDWTCCPLTAGAARRRGRGRRHSRLRFGAHLGAGRRAYSRRHRAGWRRLFRACAQLDD